MKFIYLILFFLLWALILTFTLSYITDISPTIIYEKKETAKDFPQEYPDKTNWDNCEKC